MNRIGIICAMEEELKELLNILTLKKKHQFFDIVVFECQSDDKNIFLAESGIGKVNAARCA